VRSLSCGNGAVYVACDDGYIVACEGLDGAYHVTHSHNDSGKEVKVRPCVIKSAQEVAALVYNDTAVLVRTCMLV
jgi:hypothetical protein